MHKHAGLDADVKQALAALERFVVENDDLLELEERIGRFNIFDALRIVEDGPEEEQVLAAVKKKLDELTTRLAEIPAALGPVFGN